MSQPCYRPQVAIVLAAGVGRRLGDSHRAPKVLLSFGGRSLLQRRLEALRAQGVARVSITVGHQAETIRAEVARTGLGDGVSFVENPDYHQGSLVSVAAQGELLRAGPVLLMDGDVLHDERMVERLYAGEAPNTLLVDRELEPGDEPVKVCFDAAGAIVDLRKVPANAGVGHGESVGFFRLSAQTASALADRCDAYLAQGRRDLEYEEPLRDLILADPGAFAAVDVTDLPWTEIDFEADVARARDEILPRLETRA